MKDITAFIYILFSQGQRKFPGLREKNKEAQVCFKDTASVSGKYPLEISLSGVCLVHYTHQLVSNSRQKKNCNERERGGKALIGVALNFTPVIEKPACVSQLQSDAWTAGAEV